MIDNNKENEKPSPEVIGCIRRSNRQLRYFTYDLKAEKIIIDYESETVTLIPSREDSYDRLTELGKEYADEDINVEDLAIKNIMLEKLRESMKLLTDAELFLISQIIENRKSERQLAKLLGISHTAVGKRWDNLCEKLRKSLQN